MQLTKTKILKLSGKYIKDLNPNKISDFSMRLTLGDATVDKVPEIVETLNTHFCEIAYRKCYT